MHILWFFLGIIVGYTINYMQNFQKIRRCEHAIEELELENKIVKQQLHSLRKRLLEQETANDSSRWSHDNQRNETTVHLQS